MRILTIRTQRDAAAARARLIDATASPEAALHAEALLRAANPHLDLDNLAPGAVVLVPDAPELNTQHTEESRAVGLEATVAAVGDELATLERSSGAALEVHAGVREASLKELRSRAVKAIEDADAALKPELDRLRRRLAADAREEPAQRGEFERVLKQATTDFEALRKRFG